MTDNERTCTYHRWDGTPCGRDLYDGEYCIFHSKEIKKKRHKFNKDAYFGDTTFVGVNFNDTQFDGRADFWNARFFLEIKEGNKEARKLKASFDKAKFNDVADFKNIGFDIDKKRFSMNNTYIYDVSGLFEHIEKNEKVFKKLRKISNTLKTEFLPKNFKLILGEEASAKYPVQSRQIKDDMYLLDKKERNSNTKGIKGWGYRTLYFLWWLFADYGRSFLQWALWSLIFAEIFAMVFGLFYYCNPASIKSEFISLSWPGISLLYYSIVTFTTLGFGDIVPKIPILQIIVMLEVILGYIMLGGLISILANKLARRS